MGNSPNETASAVPSAWIEINGSRFRKQDIQGYDAEFFPHCSLGGPHGDYAFLWLVGKEKPVRIALEGEKCDVFLKRIQKELDQMPPTQVTPIALIPVRQGTPT